VGSVSRVLEHHGRWEKRKESTIVLEGGQNNSINNDTNSKKWRSNESRQHPSKLLGSNLPCVMKTHRYYNIIDLYWLNWRPRSRLANSTKKTRERGGGMPDASGLKYAIAHLSRESRSHRIIKYAFLHVHTLEMVISDNLFLCGQKKWYPLANTGAVCRSNLTLNKSLFRSDFLPPNQFVAKDTSLPLATFVT